MKKVMLDGKEVEKLVPESLPMLIHGKEGSGASVYTVSLAAKWFSQGYNVFVLCGYQKAEQEFAQQVGSEYSKAKFYTSDKLDEFIAEVKQGVPKNTIIIIKNIELFDEELFDAVVAFDTVIISGDVDGTSFKSKLLMRKFTTEVYFSPLAEKIIPELEKFHGYVVSGEYKGITKLSE